MAQVYSIEDMALCLTGTAEVPLGGLYMGSVLQEAELPKKMVAFGHCFRTEAGAAGQAGKGLFRVHQFSKVGCSCWDMLGHAGTLVVGTSSLCASMCPVLQYPGGAAAGDVSTLGQHYTNRENL